MCADLPVGHCFLTRQCFRAARRAPAVHRRFKQCGGGAEFVRDDSVNDEMPMTAEVGVRDTSSPRLVFAVALHHRW